jgi:hypothetical protein
MATSNTRNERALGAGSSTSMGSPTSGVKSGSSCGSRMAGFSFIWTGAAGRVVV